MSLAGMGSVGTSLLPVLPTIFRPQEIYLIIFFPPSEVCNYYPANLTAKSPSKEGINSPPINESVTSANINNTTIPLIIVEEFEVLYSIKADIKSQSSIILSENVF
jgi:hypothetical protein